MKYKTRKKALLAIATSTFPSAAAFIAQGKVVEGTILTVFAVIMALGYDYYDDRAKGNEPIEALFPSDVPSLVAKILSKSDSDESSEEP